MTKIGVFINEKPKSREKLKINVMRARLISGV